MSQEELTRTLQSTLLYFETCLVDSYGRFQAQKMNEDDFKAADLMKNRGILDYGRLEYKAIQKLRGNPGGAIYTHWVRFTNEGWRLAAELRFQRSQRMIENKKAELEKEMTAISDNNPITAEEKKQ